MNNITTNESKVPEKLWDLANIITGFAVVQGIATAFQVASGGFETSLTGDLQHWGALVAILLFTGFYTKAIVWCYKEASPRDPCIEVSVWKAVTYGRVAAVLLFTVVTLVTVGGHWWKHSSQSSGTADLQIKDAKTMP